MFLRNSWCCVSIKASIRGGQFYHQSLKCHTNPFQLPFFLSFTYSCFHKISLHLPVSLKNYYSISFSHAADSEIFFNQYSSQKLQIFLNKTFGELQNEDPQMPYRQTLSFVIFYKDQCVGAHFEILKKVTSVF